MNLNLEGKVVLVSGASAGIGKATSKIFAQEGARLIICARNKEKIEKVKRELIQSYPVSTITALAEDLHTKNGRRNFIQHALDTYDSIDVLVNNTSGPVLSHPESATEENWNDIFEGKLQCYMSMINLVLPYMKQRQSGRIINVIGATGQEPSFDLLAAGAVNASLINFSKAMSDITARDHVLINSVNPGYIHTERFEQFSIHAAERLNCSKDNIKNQIAEKIPLKRLGTAEEVANLIVFLASECASYINGVSINVDGGLCRSAF